MKFVTLPQKTTGKTAPEPSKSASEVKTKAHEGLSRPPRHLSRCMKSFWAEIFATRKLEPYESAILLEACLAFDRAEGPRKVLQQEGLTYIDRFGQPRARPEISVERDSRLLFAKLIKQLNLYLPTGWTAGLR